MGQLTLPPVSIDGRRNEKVAREAETPIKTIKCNGRANRQGKNGMEGTPPRAAQFRRLYDSQMDLNSEAPQF